MSTRKQARPLLAVLLAFLYPGLGHVYLREWLRALVWFFLNVTSFALLMPENAVPETIGMDSLLRAAESVPPEAALALASITVFSMIDAYWMAKRQNTETAVQEGTTCPNCGRDVDADLDFCHWCTERLAPEAETEGESESESEDPGTGA
ncbi:zinc ribbon domain-containing protein [Halosimplex salinum]|uniref:zinc ribbon domain-containing protein n=1 Tax=Halosimplex salinum TaxID=1710538 RepID=UPI000F49F68C|nr:zinc ribbon domain-containing protein [Halosimplex salinum]